MGASAPEAALAPAGAATQGALTVYPQMVVNGAPSDAVAGFLLQDERTGSLCTDDATLRKLGLHVPPALLARALVPGGSPAGHAGEPGSVQCVYALKVLEGLDVRYDAPRQVLELTAPLAWLNLRTTEIGRLATADETVVRPGYAAVLNYDTNVSRSSNGGHTQAMLAEGRITTPYGYLDHTQLWSHARSGTGVATDHDVRLDTSWRTVWPDQALALTLGDLVTSQIGSVGGSRLGGIRLEHTYTLQPWRSTAPLLSYLGQTTLPGTVDLYLNGVKQYSQQVPAGNYQLTLPPGINGSGVAQVVTTDVLGRTVVVDMPLYGGTGLLARGLTEWSVESGYLRKDYGLRSDSYGSNPVWSANWRRGLTDAWTLQLHGEGTRDYWQGGASTAVVLGRLGQLNATHVQSRLAGHAGRTDSMQFTTQRQGLSFSAGWSRSEDAFATLANALTPESFAPEGLRTHTASVSMGWSGGRWGNWSLAFLRSHKDGDVADRIATLNWNRNLGRRVSLFVGGNRNFASTREQWGVFAGISVSLDHNYSVSVNGSRNSDGSSTVQTELRKSTEGVGSVGWSVGGQRSQAADGAVHYNGVGSAQASTPYGDGWANLYADSNGQNWNATWRGGLVWAQGGLFASRSVTDSFAVVSTNGVSGVPVYVQNNLAGKTDDRGLLLVPGLLSLQKNALAIDTLNLPADMHIAHNRLEAVPSEKSGMAVTFGLEKVRAATVVLRNAAGTAPLPAGSTVSDAAGQPVAVVGYDGLLYLEGLAEGPNRYTVTVTQGAATSCHVTLEYHEKPGESGLRNLGEMRCEP